VLVFGDKHSPRVFEMAPALTPPRRPGAHGRAPAKQESPWLLIRFRLPRGLVLNLMPCVFPVLGIKVMSLVKRGASRHARVHGKAYAAAWWFASGCWRLAVLLRSFGQAVAGFPACQQPLFVNPAHLAPFPSCRRSRRAYPLERALDGRGSGLADREGYSRLFFYRRARRDGGHPCTAPFMGTAIGALSESRLGGLPGFHRASAWGSRCPSSCFATSRPFESAAQARRLDGTAERAVSFSDVATVLWLLWVPPRSARTGPEGGARLLVLMVSVWARNRFDPRACEHPASLSGHWIAPGGLGEPRGRRRPARRAVPGSPTAPRRSTRR